jgi:hypothetical protein
VSISESRSRLAGKRWVIPATIDGLGAKKFKPELGAAWLASARPILTGRLRHLISWETARWRSMDESRLLCVCMLTDPLWWMCQLESFQQWIRTQMLFWIDEIISIIWYNSDIMRIIQKEKGMNLAHVTGRRAFLLMWWQHTSHRIDGCRPAVRRSRLQAAKLRTDIQNNRYNTRNNAYNSHCSHE